MTIQLELEWPRGLDAEKHPCFSWFLNRKETFVGERPVELRDLHTFYHILCQWTGWFPIKNEDDAPGFHSRHRPNKFSFSKLSPVTVINLFSGVSAKRSSHWRKRLKVKALRRSMVCKMSDSSSNQVVSTKGQGWFWEQNVRVFSLYCVHFRGKIESNSGHFFRGNANNGRVAGHVRRRAWCDGDDDKIENIWTVDEERSGKTEVDWEGKDRLKDDTERLTDLQKSIWCT